MEGEEGEEEEVVAVVVAVPVEVAVHARDQLAAVAVASSLRQPQVIGLWEALADTKPPPSFRQNIRLCVRHPCCFPPSFFFPSLVLLLFFSLHY